ncbi:MAG: sulfatase family protein, partial [Planctomycetota bacterium]
LNIYENTFILFTSDNGPAWQGNAGPWKGGKTDLHEAGIRVPMCAVWPGYITAGTHSEELAHTNDILPTFCAAAKVKLPAKTEIDGINLLPHLTKNKPIENRGTVFWQVDFYKTIQRFYPKPKPYATEVARRGKWKLLAKDGKPVALYDLNADPGEITNRLTEYPKIVKQLESELKEWLAAPRKSWIKKN